MERPSELGVADGRPWAMRHLRAVRRTIVGSILVASIAGCAGGAAATLGPSPATTPGPSLELVTTATEAVERVVAHEPRFAGIRPYDTGLIGQASWYTVQPGSGVGAFIVTIRVGWGDCQAGCIEEHGWIYAVAPDGAVTLVSETGEPIPPPAWPSPITGGATGIAGLITAGPVCPIETVPPDPDCAARPVADAKMLIRDGEGNEIARAVTDADGAFFVALPAGDYLVEPQPVDGLLGIAAAQHVTVVDGGTAEIALEYDTGIR